jgi:hypothetical protein
VGAPFLASFCEKWGLPRSAGITLSPPIAHLYESRMSPGTNYPDQGRIALAISVGPRAQTALGARRCAWGLPEMTPKLMLQFGGSEV